MKKALLIVSLTLTACGGGNRFTGNNMLPVNADNVVNIDVAISTSNKNFFTDFIDDVRFVPIETDSLKIIGDIDKIITYNNDYYILDRRQTRSLWRIDQEGKFVNRIGRVGRGPGEFLEPTDFIVNSSGVIVLDQFSRSLLFYDHNGVHHKSVPLPFVVYEITGMPDESMIFAVAGDNRRNKEIADKEYIVINTMGDLISQGIANKNRLNYMPGYRSFLHNSEVVYQKDTGKTVSGPAIMSLEGKSPTAKDMLLLGLNNSLGCNGSEIIGYLNAHYLAHESITKSYPALHEVNESGNPIIFHFKPKL